MEYNVNTKATVTLTEKGAFILNEFIEKYESNPPYTYKEGDTYSSELWEIMNIFGDCMYMTCEIPFKDNIIDIEEYKI